MQIPLLPDPPKVYTVVLPHWLPDKAVEWLLPEGQTDVTVTLPKAVKNALRMAQRISTSQWAARYRRLPGDAAIPGKWSNDVAPYLVEIMDAADFPFVRRIVLCKCPQSGGTETAHNIVGKRLDTHPVPVLYNYPERDTAKENCRDRILLMIKQSPRLSTFLTGLQDDESSLRIKLLTTNIYMAWSGSASRLGNRPIGVLVLDETNKYGQPANETSAILLARKRLITYERQNKSLEVMLSTPTIEKDGGIWDALHNETQVVFDYHVKCPKCETLQLMTDDNLTWEGDQEAHPEDVEQKKRGRYVCPKCNDKWDDNRRDLAVRSGVWRDRETGRTFKTVMAVDKPGAVGFHLPSWISYFVSLSKSAAAKIRSGLGPKEKQDYVNQFKAEAFSLVVMEKDESHIEKCRCDMEAGVLPPLTVLVTCGIDVQRYGFWYAVRAWAGDGDSWLVDYGQVLTWDDVAKLVYETTFPIMGSNVKSGIDRVGVDVGGGIKDVDVTMTEETELWLAQHQRRPGPRVWGTKGSPRRMTEILRVGQPLMKTPAGRPLKGGIRIITLNTDMLKATLHDRFERALEGDKLAARLHKDTGKDYVKQILAEELREDAKGHKKWVPVAKDNHLLDCEAINMACAHITWPGAPLRALPLKAAGPGRRRAPQVSVSARIGGR